MTGILLAVFRRQLTEAAVRKLAQFLDEQRVFLSWEESDFTLSGGLRLTGVSLFEAKERKIPTARLTEIQVAAPLRAAFDRSKLIFEFKANEATLELFSDGETVEIRELDLFLEARSDRLLVKRFSAEHGGLTLKTQGEIQFAAPVQPSPPPSNPQASPEPPAEESPPLESSVDLEPIARFLANIQQLLDGHELELDGEFQLTPAAEGVDLEFEAEARGVPSGRSRFDSKGRLSFLENGDIEIERFELLRGRRGLRFQARYLADSEIIRLDSCRSDLNWFEVLRESEDPPEWIGQFRKLAPLTIELSGDLAASESAETTIEFAVPNFAFEFKDVAVTEMGIQGNLTDQALSVGDARGRLLGGSFFFAGSTQRDAEVAGWDVNLQLTDLSLAEILAVGQAAPQPGRVTANFKGKTGESLSAIDVSGDFALKNARFDSTPVLGPLRKLLTRAVPSKMDGATDEVAGNFTISEGKLATNDLVVSVPAFRATIKGEADLVAETGRFTALATPRGPVVELAAKLPGKALEIEGEGSLDGIQWRFKNVELVKKVFQNFTPPNPIRVVPKVKPLPKLNPLKKKDRE